MKQQPKLHVRLSEEDADLLVAVAEYGASAMLDASTGKGTRAAAFAAKQVATRFGEAVESAKRPLMVNL